MRDDRAPSSPDVCSGPGHKGGRYPSSVAKGAETRSRDGRVGLRLRSLVSAACTVVSATAWGAVGYPAQKVGKE